MLDAMLGGVVAAVLGKPFQERHFSRLAERARRGEDVSFRSQLHRRSAPTWRWQRGRLFRRRDRLVWRAWLQPWQSVELSDATVAGSELRKSAADGDHVEVIFAAERADGLRVPVEAARLAEAVLHVEHLG